MGFVAKSSAASQNSDFVGAIRHFGTSSLPSGFLPCDGAAVSRTVYASLFAAIGTAFGAGDGSTTFNVPDLRGRTLIGDGTGPGLSARTLGASLGAETHQLTVAEMPSHNHGGGSHSHSVSAWGPGSGGSLAGPGANIVQNPPSLGTSGSGTIISTQGSDNAHNNMQPSAVCKFGIRYLDTLSYTAPTPTIQKFLSGSGTYNTPAGCKWIRIRMAGGGGGGAGSGLSGSGGVGADGNDSTFGSLGANQIIASKGLKGVGVAQQGGAGGSATLGAIAVGLGLSGGAGQGGSYTSQAYDTMAGGQGGSNPLGGGGGGGSYNSAGQSGTANTGAGGGGAGAPNDSTPDSRSGAGGGAGAYVDVIIVNPSASYPYSVGEGGSGGSAGTNGYVGGSGARGVIIVEEYY